MIITQEKNKIGFTFEEIDSFFEKEFVKIKCDEIRVLIQLLGERKNE